MDKSPYEFMLKLQVDDDVQYHCSPAGGTVAFNASCVRHMMGAIKPCMGSLEDISLQWTGQPKPHCIKHSGSLLISQRSASGAGWHGSASDLWTNCSADIFRVQSVQVISKCQIQDINLSRGKWESDWVRETNWAPLSSESHWCWCRVA